MHIKNIIVLIGAPGTGKGTQGKLLAPILNYNYLSMGATLREFAKLKSPEAKEVRISINSGKIIPDQIIKKIFHETLMALPKAEGLILDGFPRDIDQIGILDDAIIKYKVGKVKGLFIDVPKIHLLGRLQKRGGIESRADDNPAVIETRFKEFEEKTFPLVRYFEQNYWMVHINGDQSVEMVHAEIIKKLNHGQAFRI